MLTERGAWANVRPSERGDQDDDQTQTDTASSGWVSHATLSSASSTNSVFPCRATLSPSSDKRTVLVVEDEVLQRMMLADDLADAGFHVVQAANAAEALDVLQSGVSLDVVITDVRMPGGIDGLELAAQARVIAPHLKIIVDSGHLLGLPDKAVADSLIAKPYASSAILDCVTRLLTMGEQWQDKN
jgi:CheY-like chemotaxis protein